MFMQNLYDDIISDSYAGSICGQGLTTSKNIGKDCEVYEAVHGRKKLPNSKTLLLSEIMMLKAMKSNDYANIIEYVTYALLQEIWVVKLLHLIKQKLFEINYDLLIFMQQYLFHVEIIIFYRTCQLCFIFRKYFIITDIIRL